MLQQILDMLLNEKTLAVVVTAALGWLGKFVVGAVRQRNVAQAAYHAYHIVEDLADDVNDGSKLDDALEWSKAILKSADDWCRAHGWRALKPGEEAAVMLRAKSLSGQQLVAEATVSPK